VRNIKTNNWLTENKFNDKKKSINKKMKQLTVKREREGGGEKNLVCQHGKNSCKRSDETSDYTQVKSWTVEYKKCYNNPTRRRESIG